MATFLIVLAWIVGGAFVLALLVWPLVVFMLADDVWGWSVRTRVLHCIGSVLVLALVMTWAIDAGVFSSNNADHCGPGTHYVSESHYNPATKSSITEWMCVA